MAVGQITEPKQAETIIATAQADLVALARGMLWDPRWTWKAAVALGAEITLPAPYARCNPALAATPFVKRSER
jgi:2,4-dienoyl-CoA reductase-like NADH-dependent reductase (Old Yellow Enzyme family)